MRVPVAAVKDPAILAILQGLAMQITELENQIAILLQNRTVSFSTVAGNMAPVPLYIGSTRPIAPSEFAFWIDTSDTLHRVKASVADVTGTYEWKQFVKGDSS